MNARGYRPPCSEYSFCCSNRGVPHPRSRSRRGIPHPRSRSQGGTPSLDRGTPCPRLDGVPPSKAGWGYPLSSDGGTPPSKAGQGYPPIQGWMGVSSRVWTDKQSETITFPILRMRAVMMESWPIDQHHTVTQNLKLTRKSSCVNVRGILPAV